MQINLPIDPTPPAPNEAPSMPAPSQSEPRQSFEHYLGSGEQSPVAKKPAAECSSPAVGKTAPEDSKEPAKTDDEDLDPKTAAELAALAAGLPAPLPPPPVAVPVSPDLPPAVIAAPAGIPAEPAANTAAGAEVLPPQPASGSLAAKAEKAAPSFEQKNDATPEELAAEEIAPATNTPLSLPRAKSGTPAAMDRSTMSNPVPNRPVKAAGISLADKAPAFAMAAHSTGTVTQAAVKPVAAAAETSTSSDSQTASNFLQSAASNPQPAAAAAPTEATAKTERITQDVNLTLDHVERLTENMKTTGSHQMEMEVRLHDDSKVTISIQMDRGELKTTFKTDSTELRDALANNWGQVSDKNSDRSIRLTPPVFESSDARNGFSGDSRQQGRASSQADPEAQPFSFLAPAKPASATPVAAESSDSGLALYA